MPVHDDLGIRMKTFYEGIPKTKLMRRCPVVIRVDGRSFHTFTRNFQKPFDEVLINSMQKTMRYLCENIQGCVLGYTQSDEISLILIDYKKLDSAGWFDYEVQKMCSIAASMATMAFNGFFDEELGSFYESHDALEWLEDKSLDDLFTAYSKALKKGAMFDARVFNIPKEEVTNYVYWRQIDATRNSIQMLGQAHFSHKELQNKSCNQIQDMLMTQKGINWNNLPTHLKRGSCCVKEKFFLPDKNGLQIDDDSRKGTWRSRWVIDKEIPIFKCRERVYIDDLIYVGE